MEFISMMSSLLDRDLSEDSQGKVVKESRNCSAKDVIKLNEDLRR